MNLIPTLGPIGWTTLAAIAGGVVLLYFLKLRREPVTVPSTFLWSRTIEDLHVNSLLQRLRRSLLLLLQLLVLAMAALALLRPGAEAITDGLGRTVYLLDTSASMRARDADGETSRFEVAKRLIRGDVDAMTNDQSAMLITMSDRAETVQAFTSDRRRLREALDSVVVTSRTTDISGALRAADGLANPRRTSQAGDLTDVQVADAMPADLVIYSDGGFPPVIDFSLGNLEPTYVPMGDPQTSNVAVTAFSAQRDLENASKVEVFATVKCFGRDKVTTTATLYADDPDGGQSELLDASEISLGPGDETGLTFKLERDGAIALRLVLDADDGLPVDNLAFAALAPLRPVRVLLISDGNKPIETALTTEKAIRICDLEVSSPSYLETESYKDRAAEGRDDLIIFDRCVPPEMPLTNTFFIGVLPPRPETGVADRSETDDVDGGLNPGWSWDGPPAPVVPIDIDRSHPVMRFLELYSLLIFEGRGVIGPPGSRELLGADVGSVLVIAPRDGYQDLVLGFEVLSIAEDGTSQSNTDWFVQRSWPVFWYNVLRDVAGAADVGGASSFRPGSTVRLRIENAASEVTVQRNDETPRTLPIETGGVINLTETDDTGIYRVRVGNRLVEQFVVNLFSERESDIVPAADIALGYTDVEGESASVSRRKEYWRYLLLAMLGLIAAEWWVYARRVG